MTAVPAALPQPEAVLPGWFTSLQLQTAGMPVLSSKQLENVPVVVPPPGVVGLRSLAYRRTVVPGQGTMLVAVLPASREDDLRAGASAEAGTTAFWRSSCGVGRSRRYCCPRGVTKTKPAKPPVPGAKPHRGVAQQHGEDKTPFFTGCKVAYSATRDGDRLIVKLSYDALEHNHNTSTARRFVPAWVRESIRTQFLAANGRRIDAKTLAEQINAEAMDAVMAEGEFTDVDAALNAWLKKEALPPREAFVDTKYVTDMLRRLSRDKDEVITNQEDAVAEWVDSVGDDVFYYMPGKAVEKGVEEDVRPRAYNTGLQY